MANQSDTHHSDTQHDGAGGAGTDHGAGAGMSAGAGNEHGAPHTTDVHTSTAADGGVHKDVGFPPFNPDTFAPQLIWLVLSFTALYLLMSRIALPRVGEIIEERGDRIKRDLETAERLKVETEKALGAYEQALADARSNASEIAKETRNKLTAEVDTERARNDEEIGAQVADAEVRIASTQKKALASVNEIAGDVAGSLVSKLIGTEVSAAEVKVALATRTSNS